MLKEILKNKIKKSLSKDHRKNISLAMNRPEVKKKTSEGNFKRYKENPGLKEQISKKLKGIKKSEKTRKKMRESHLDKKPTEETRKKMKDNNWMKKHKGKNNPNWLGGKSLDFYPIDWTDDLRESIRKRDNYICQECGIHQDELVGWNNKLDVHHIDYDKDNLDPKNLITLCRSCHQKTNFNREYWTDCFQSKRSSKELIKIIKEIKK